MKKTFLLFFMAFACLVASYGQMLFNYTDALGTTWKFSLETDGAYIIDATQGSNHFSGVLNIPGTVEKDGQSYPVAGIGYKNNAISSSNSFFNNNDITGITFPPSLTSIGSYVMFGCKGLTHVTIPSTVKKIGIRAFGSCIYNHRTTKTNQKYPSVNL